MAMIGPNGKVVQPLSLWEQAGAGQEGARVSWSDVDGEVLVKALVALTESGVAVTLGMTSDGGALMVAVLDNGKVLKSYFHEIGMLEAKLNSLIKLA